MWGSRAWTRNWYKLGRLDRRPFRPIGNDNGRGLVAVTEFQVFSEGRSTYRSRTREHVGKASPDHFSFGSRTSYLRTARHFGKQLKLLSRGSHIIRCHELALRFIGIKKIGPAPTAQYGPQLPTEVNRIRQSRM